MDGGARGGSPKAWLVGWLVGAGRGERGSYALLYSTLLLFRFISCHFRSIDELGVEVYIARRVSGRLEIECAVESEVDPVSLPAWKSLAAKLHCVSQDAGAGACSMLSGVWGDEIEVGLYKTWRVPGWFLSAGHPG